MVKFGAWRINTNYHNLHNMRRLLLILILISIGFSQNLPKEYQLLLEFLRTKDIKLGYRILEEHPDAVFIHDVRVLIADELRKRSKRNESVSLLRDIDPKKLRPDLKNVYKNLWLTYKLSISEAFVKDPTLFAEFAQQVRIDESKAKDIFRELFNRRYYKTIVTLYENHPYTHVCDIYGASLYRLKDKRALEVLTTCQRTDLRDEYLARAYLNMGDEYNLLSIVEQNSNIGLLVGRIFLSQGKYDKAWRFLQKAPDSYEKHFSLGLISYILHRYDDAVNYFQQSLLYTRSSQEIARSNFWISKSYLALGMQEASTKHLFQSSKGSGLYSIVSKLYIGEPIHSNIILRLSSEDFPRTAIIIKSINEAGLPYYSRLEAFRRIKDVTPSDILEISKFDPFLSIRLAARKYGVRSDIYNAVAFPKPYASYVLFYSNKYNLDPNLVFAIMKQESLFDPQATSVANARGLMQIIDSTARWIAQREGIVLRNVYDIDTNINLGTAYIRYLMDYWKGDLVRVIASYNAGEGRVRSFTQSPDPYIFMETIPISETRNYVQNVLYNYYIYSSLN